MICKNKLFPCQKVVLLFLNLNQNSNKWVGLKTVIEVTKMNINCKHNQCNRKYKTKKRDKKNFSQKLEIKYIIELQKTNNSDYKE